MAIDNPTVPGHAFMPGPTKLRTPKVSRGKVMKVPKSMTSPTIREPKMKKPRDSMRLRVPKGKVIK